MFSFVYHVPPTCVCECVRASRVFAWMGRYCNLTIHTLLINYLYCIVRYVFAKIPQGTNLFFLFFVLCTFTHTVQLFLVFFSCHSLIFSGSFSKHRKSCMADDIVHARQTFWNSCVLVKHLVLQLWMTNLDNSASYCTIRTDVYSGLISCNKNDDKVLFTV